MNNPPDDGKRVSKEHLLEFVKTIGMKAGLPGSRAGLLADLLVTNDLRGIFSHGTQQIAAYGRLMRDGVLNCNPQVTVVKESPVSIFMDGDGGLGYFAAYDGTQKLIPKALESGIAVMASRNHGHFGAAGIYARMPVGHDLITFVTSGHQLNLKPGDQLFSAAGGSPMAFSAPGLEGPPLVVDFGCMHDLYASDPHRDEVAKLTPGLVLRSIGLGEICQTWGGFLSGLFLDPEKRPWSWQGANQGALVICLRIDLFSEATRFKGEVDAYGKRITELLPLPQFDRSFMAGAVESAREAEYAANGMAVSEDHQRILNDLVVEFDIEPL